MDAFRVSNPCLGQRASTGCPCFATSPSQVPHIP